MAGGARFAPGRLVATVGALAALVAAGVRPAALVSRHLRSDWGDLGEEDRRENARALLSGDRLLSAYALPSGGHVWVITEADRSATSRVVADEY